MSYCGNITNAGLEHVAQLKQLTSLKLYYCRNITDTGLEHVSPSYKLGENERMFKISLRLPVKVVQYCIAAYSLSLFPKMVLKNLGETENP